MYKMYGNVLYKGNIYSVIHCVHSSPKNDTFVLQLTKNEAWNLLSMLWLLLVIISFKKKFFYFYFFFIYI